MHRRRLVGRLSSLLAVGALAGCSNNQEVPVTAPEGPVENRERGEIVTSRGRTDESGESRTTVQRLVVPDWEAGPGANGQLVVTVTVRNRGRSARTALVRVVAGAGNDEYVGERFVSLDSGDQTTLEMTFPVEYETFDARPSLSFDVVPRTPRTPVPTDVDSGPTDEAAESGSGSGSGSATTSTADVGSEAGTETAID